MERFCVSCYKGVKSTYSYCWKCNQMKAEEKLSQCKALKLNSGERCKLLCVNDFCYWHRVEEEDNKKKKKSNNKKENHENHYEFIDEK